MSLLSPQDRVKENALAIKAVSQLVQEKYLMHVQGRSYLMVAGAQAVASSMGYTTAIESLRYVPATEAMPGYWEAVATVNDGAVVVGRGIGSVFDNESPWNKRPQFARQAMAQTRATGRALKGVMGWATALLGAETSLHEEMPTESPTTAQDASDDPRRLPALPKAPARPGATGAPVVRGICSHVEVQESKKGKKYWRIALERPDGGSDWFTSFKAVDGSALIGKSVELQLREEKKPDGSVGHICEDIWDVEEVRF